MAEVCSFSKDAFPAILQVAESLAQQFMEVELNWSIIVFEPPDPVTFITH